MIIHTGTNNVVRVSSKTIEHRLEKLESNLKHLVHVTDTDSLAITETWLNDKVSKSEIFTNEYCLYRRETTE